MPIKETDFRGQQLKVVGKSGQISIGKAMAGMGFIMETLPGGDILLKHAVVIPAKERWLNDQLFDLAASLAVSPNPRHFLKRFFNILSN